MPNLRPTVALACLLALVATTACTRDGGGGGRNADVHSPNPTFELTTAAALPVPRTEVAGAALDGKMFVVGGLVRDGSPSRRVDVYEADRWTEGPELPMPLHHVGVAAARGRVWVAGGYTIGPQAGVWEPSAAVISLGPGEPAWRTEPPLRTPRGAPALAAIGETLVIVGGVVAGSPVASVEFFRAVEKGGSAWEAGPELREVREHLAATTIGDRMYAIGGRAGAMETNRRTVESWDGRAPAWREEPTLNDTRGGTAAAGACVVGGEEPRGTIATVECLDVDGSEARWEVAARLREPRHGVAVVALGDALHVIGGGPTPGLSVSGAHEVLTPNT